MKCVIVVVDVRFVAGGPFRGAAVVWAAAGVVVEEPSA